MNNTVTSAGGEMPICASANCVDCRARTAKLTRAPKRAAARVDLPGARRPTREELEKHAERFGNADKVGPDAAKATVDAVLRTADELGITVGIKKIKKPRRGKTGPTLKERVAAHLEDERSIEFIAEMENLAPSRARRIVAELTEAEHGE